MVKVLPVSTKKELKKFIRFKNNLYKGHKYAIPVLEIDELSTLTPSKNPASEFCQWQCFLAYNQKGKIVGRICAILNNRAVETWGKREGRFSFFDFIEDIEVAGALLDVAKRWVKERGMESIIGPMGFTNMDEEGMLVEGYQELGTKATLYNYAYYNDFMEQLGWKKSADWVEFRIKIPETMPDKIVRLASIVEQKYDLRTVKCKNTKEMVDQGWGTKIFDLINKEYAKLYGYNSMTQHQIDHYVKMYLPVARIELIAMVADRSDNLIGFGISLPSLSRALQKSKGRILPFGWFHLLRALKGKKSETIDLMLIAVDGAYQNKGVTSLIMREVISGMQNMEGKWAESNPELEVNETMHRQWDIFEHRQHRRRRCYTLPLE